MRVNARCGTCRYGFALTPELMGSDPTLARVRKVRCDSGRPACRRCVSTGRTCEGYGVWGGGNNPFDHQPPIARVPLPIPPSILPISSGPLTSSERSYAEWFVRVTAIYLPGFFPSTFWHRLVLQANLHEPAVLHATVALAAAEKRSFLENHSSRAESKLDDEQRFILYQYNKAIRHVRLLFSSSDRASARVLLVACMIFTCLEFILGRYKAGYTHLSNGLRLLNEMTTVEGGYEESWLREVFFTLTVHSALFQSYSPCRYAQNLLTPFDFPLLTRCESISQARQQLDRLLSATHHLLAQRLRHDDPRPPADLLLRQRHICKELHAWKAAFDVLKARIFSASSQVAHHDNQTLRVLSIHHTLASILSETCLRGKDENMFDHYTHSFGTLLQQVVGLIELVSPQRLSNTPLYIGCGRYHFSADMGFIPPLFYTALKCRVLCMRMQAVKLLRVLGHQEGIWDATLTAAVAEQVILSEDERARDGLSMDSYSFPLARDLLKMMVPEHVRVQQVNITLPEEPKGNVEVICERRQANGLCELFRWEFTYAPGKGYVAVQASDAPSQSTTQVSSLWTLH